MYSMSESSSHAFTFSTFAFLPAGASSPLSSFISEALRFGACFEGAVGVDVVVGLDGDDVRPCFCLAKRACMPSLRSWIGWMNVGDSVPILPTSLGTW